MKISSTHTCKSAVILLFFLLLIVSCGSTKSLVSDGEANPKLSAKQLIKGHQKNDANFKTLQGRAKIGVTQGERSQGATFTLRMQKDKVIWLSAPLGLIRMMITPNKVQFYNKTDNSYFDGDYKLLSDFAGFELDFQKVQNILLGQAIYDLKAQPHQVDIQENSYVLSPKKQNPLLELFYLMNATHYKLNSLQMQQAVKQRFLQVDYKSYQNIERNIIPKLISVIAVEGTDQALIDMEIKSVNLNDEVRFPFKIPSGYKKIELE